VIGSEKVESGPK